MKVVHLSTYDIKGGAAISAHRLHRGLLGAGCESSMLVKYKSSPDPAIAEFVLPMDLRARWRRRVRRHAIVKSIRPYVDRKPAGFELFSEDRTPYGGSLLEQIPSYDVLNLHWVAAFVDYEMLLPAASKRGAVVWTLHDMNAVTGGCHYDMECGRYAQRCGACPQLASQNSEDLAAQVWDRKRAAFERIDPRKLCIVTPSRWLASVAKRSPLVSRFRIETIPYGLDLDAFAPRERAAAREVLGIPKDAKVVLFVSEMVDNHRKGFALLAQALAGCVADVERLWLLSVGNNAPKIEGGLQGAHLNYLGNDRMLSMVYSAADVFVIASLQDNLPNTVLEAMACGTAVVGFDVGGVRDMVRHEGTGLLASPGDVEGLRSAIVRLLRDPSRCRDMGAQARCIATDEYPLALQGQRYAHLYKELLG